jgi:uncharacterized protein YoxC
MRVNFTAALAAAAALSAAPGLAAQTIPDPSPQREASAIAAPVLQSRDTLLMKQVESDPGWWEQMTSIASGLMTISILVLTAALVPAAWNFRKNHKAIREMIDKFQGDIAPLLRHANAIADDVNYVTTSIRVDVQHVNQTVAAANRRLLDAVDKAESRINDFNALLEVAQEEAESAFVSTASTLRGIRRGAAALGSAGGRNGRRRTRIRDRELRERMDELRAAIDEDLHEAVSDVGPGLDESFAEEEVTDGDSRRSTPDSGS